MTGRLVKCVWRWLQRRSLGPWFLPDLMLTGQDTGHGWTESWEDSWLGCIAVLWILGSKDDPHAIWTNVTVKRRDWGDGIKQRPSQSRWLCLSWSVGPLSPARGSSQRGQLRGQGCRFWGRTIQTEVMGSLCHSMPPVLPTGNIEPARKMPSIHGDWNQCHCIHGVPCGRAHLDRDMWVGCWTHACLPLIISGKVKTAPVILGFPSRRRLWCWVILLIEGPNVNISIEMSTDSIYC